MLVALKRVTLLDASREAPLLRTEVQLMRACAHPLVLPVRAAFIFEYAA